MTPALFLALALIATSCVGDGTAPEGLDCDRCDSAADGTIASLVDGTPLAVGLLRLLNDESTTLGLLDDEVPLDRRAAENLILHRDGADGIFGTADDDLFDDAAEVAGVSWVGDSAVASLLAYAQSEGWVPAGDDLLGIYDDVPFSVREAAAVLSVVNLASEATIDDEIGLDRRAVESILEARPIPSILALSGLHYVGATALERLKAFALDSEPEDVLEIGIISDLDKTVIPPTGELHVMPEAPYPGVVDLYNELEFGANGDAGDMYFVTARGPDDVAEIPAWLEAHGVPAGPIEPGIDGAFWLAESEKVADITRILEATPGQRFILFGDNNHADHRVYARILDAHPDRVAAALIHRVRDRDESTMDSRLLVYDDYAHAAALLLSRSLIDEATARGVMVAAQALGLEITDDEIDQLVIDYRPQ